MPIINCQVPRTRKGVTRIGSSCIGNHMMSGGSWMLQHNKWVSEKIDLRLVDTDSIIDCSWFYKMYVCKCTMTTNFYRLTPSYRVKLFVLCFLRICPWGCNETSLSEANAKSATCVSIPMLLNGRWLEIIIPSLRVSNYVSNSRNYCFWLSPCLQRATLA